VSVIVEEDFKRWTAKRKAALLMDIIQGKTSIAEASRSYICHPRRLRKGWKRVSGAWKTLFEGDKTNAFAEAAN
jgi:transposase-like protein